MLLFKFKFLSFLTDQLIHLHQRRWSWTEPQWRTWKPREGRRIWWQQILDIEDICGFARAKKRWIHVGEEFCKMMILFALASGLHSPHKLLCVDFSVLEEKKQFKEEVKVCARTWKGIGESDSLCKKEKRGSEKVKVEMSGWKWLRDSESRYERSEKGFAKVKVERSTLSKSAISEIWFQRFVITSLFLAYLRYHTLSIVMKLNLDKLESVALTFLGSNFPFPPWLCFLLPGTEDKNDSYCFKKMPWGQNGNFHPLSLLYLKIIFVKNSITVIVVHVPGISLVAVMIRKNYQKVKPKP